MLNLFFRKSEDNMFEDFRLKVFMAVAETGSFTKAAKSIGISQPAVSQNINALEKEIGTPLILRAKGEALPVPAQFSWSMLRAYYIGTMRLPRCSVKTDA